MTFGSLFAGIGGFDLGLERAGMECAWQVEIEDFPRRVLEAHWPGLYRPLDVCDVGGENLDPVDLICGGFPCQDLSVAGKRAGLAGERSGLFFEFMRIVDELAPSWVLIENVLGLLSSNGGRDMGAVLGTLAELGYGYAYRVLDAQFFGVAQRRRRVFIIGHRGNYECPAKVLFEPESCPRGSPPSRKERKTLASRVAGCAGADGPIYGIRSANTSSNGWGIQRELSHALDMASPHAVGPTPGFGVVRRLTPIECERLQGFPDGWTAIDGENTPDSPRYKALGNAVCVDVAEWIGRRIIREESA